MYNGERMNAKNTEKLYTDFPEFFKHRDDLQSSLMAFGFEYSDGSTRTAQDEKPADQSSNVGEDLSTDYFQTIEDDSDIPF